MILFKLLLKRGSQKVSPPILGKVRISSMGKEENEDILRTSSLPSSTNSHQKLKLLSRRPSSVSAELLTTANNNFRHCPGYLGGDGLA